MYFAGKAISLRLVPYIRKWIISFQDKQTQKQMIQTKEIVFDFFTEMMMSIKNKMANGWANSNLVWQFPAPIISTFVKLIVIVVFLSYMEV